MKKIFKLSLFAFVTVIALSLSVIAVSAAYFGDVDKDGTVTAIDARYILRTAVGLENPAADVRYIADIDGDGQITSLDARSALRMAVALDELKNMAHKHEYTSSVTTAPTCTNNGTKTLVCKICAYKTTQTIEATGHKMGEWTVYVQPTVTKEGSERRKCSQCNYYEERVLQKQNAVYFITVDNGFSDEYKIPVAADGKYTVATPERAGYTFKGWKDSAGKAFSASGTIKSDKSIYAVWEITGTDTLAKLADRTSKGADKILITADITVDRPIYISCDTEIYTEGKYAIKRHPDYAGDIFVVGSDESGRSSVLLHRQAVLTLKAENGGSLTVDGNRANVKTTVKGSLIYLSNSGVVNIYDGIKLINNEKLGNERADECLGFVSNEAVSRVGGAAIAVMNGTVNMYGGVMENNAVVTDASVGANETNACGGAVYNRGSFNMYGGEIKNNEALRGGAVYNDECIIIEAGNISGNKATTYGGAISSSGSSDSQIFIGSESGNKKITFADNSSVKAGGAIYSNTNSPIVIYGNTLFSNNSAQSIGGAVYTGGGLTIRNTEFIGNISTSWGGAVYHNYSNTSFTRRDLEITDCLFEDNKAVNGGAVGLGAAETATDEGTFAVIKGSTFKNNIADAGNGSGSGGAIYATKMTELTVDGCEFTENSAVSIAGAVYVHGGTDAKISNSQFTKNSAVYGGAVNLATGSISLTKVDMTENSASYGGALYMNSVKTQFTDVKFTGNEALTYGGAMYLNGTDITIKGDSEFKENSAKYGGAVYLKTGKFNADGGTFSQNTAINGGVIDAETGSTVTVDGAAMSKNTATASGGAIYSNLSEITVNNSSFVENTSGYGGAIALMAADGADAAVIPVSIKGSTFEKNVADAGDGSGSGGAVYSTRKIDLTVDSCNFNENSAANIAGAVYVHGGTDAKISNSGFAKNSAIYGGAINLHESTLSLASCEMTENSADNGGALYIKPTVITISDMKFTGNTAKANGGAVYITGADMTVTGNSEFTGNSAKNGGAVYVTAGTLKTEGGIFTGNTVTGNGGAVDAEGGSEVIIDGTILSKNSTSDATSGGAIASFTANVTVNNVTMIENTAGYGGAVAVNGGQLTAAGTNVISDNIAKVRGGALEISIYGTTKSVVNVAGTTFKKNTAPYAGAVFMNNSTVTIDESIFEENSATADVGGAIYTTSGTHNISAAFKNNTALNFGGAIGVNGADVTLTGITATGNSAKNGGAVHVKAGKLNVTGSAFNGNTATNGGAVNVEKTADADISNCSFSSNSATNGGALILAEAQLEFTKNTLKENTAAYGGALFVNPATLEISDIIFESNSASANGGAVLLNGGTMSVSGDTAFIKNSAARGGAVEVTVNGNVFGSLTVNGAEFTENTAATGGAVSVRANCTADFDGTVFTKNASPDKNEASSKEIGGGAIFAFTDSSVTLTGVTLDGNTSANYGGGVMANGASSVIINENTVVKNSTGNTGAALYFLGVDDVKVADTEISSNTAVWNGAVYASVGTAEFKNITATKNNSNLGGTFYISSGNVDFINVNASENTAKEKGGVIYVGAGTVDMTDCSFTKNSAPNGGAVYAAGGTVNVSGGTYSENTVTGNGGAFDAESGATLTVDGATLSKNRTSDTTSGGAIASFNASVTVNNVIITENTAGYGGAVAVNGGSFTATGTNVISNNIAKVRGGALEINIYGSNNANASIAGTTFKKNTAPYAGAVFMAKSAVEMTGCVFEENSATSDIGGAVYTTSGTHNINAVFTNNTAKHGGAIGIGGADVTLTNVTATANTATNGGAVYVKAGTLNVVGGAFTENTASNGGAVDAESGTTVNINGAEFTKNTAGAGASGGAVYGIGATIDVKNSTFAENTAGYGGAFSLNGTVMTASGTNKFIKNTAVVRSGAVDVTSGASKYSSLTMTDGIFEENVAAAGGAVNIRGYCKAEFIGTEFTGNTSNDTSGSRDSGGGGAIYVAANGEATLKGVTLDGSVSPRYGGAVLVNGGKLTADADESGNKNVVKNSFAETHGAAFYLYTADATIKNTIISDNEATWKGVIYVGNTGNVLLENVTAERNKADQGGLICIVDQPSVTLKNVTATGNLAKSEGGVVYHQGWNNTLTIADCSFTSNTAGKSAGAVFAGAKAPVTINTSMFTSNSAPKGGAMVVDTTSVGGNPSAANVTINAGTRFEGNIATTGDGGAIILSDSTNTNAATKLIMTGVTFKGNKAAAMGGAISTDDNSPYIVLKATDCVFEGNIASYTSGTNGGGAIEIKNGNAYSNGEPTEMKIVFTNTTFTDNIAAGVGGAVDMRSGSYAKFDGVTATGNYSKEKWNGAVFYATSANTRLYISGVVAASGNKAGAYDTFAYSSGSPAYIYTDNASDASWIGMSYFTKPLTYVTTMP